MMMEFDVVARVAALESTAQCDTSKAGATPLPMCHHFHNVSCE
jgi:hypothetical protein